MAILSFRKRQRWHMQYWMRARVVAQGLTVGVMIMYYYRTKPNEVEKTRHLDEVSIKREERESKDRQEFLTRLKNAEDQWKEDQRPTAKEGDVKSEIPEADRAKSLKAGLPTNSGGGWWKMSWLWGSASKN
ncbi:hypothetical protein ID866_1207 [Astraeus odoratus]|nr:hypothetical protein ID866_1207 [Astraeus odoratus]